MVAYTTTYSFAKPTVGDDEDVWGGYLNGNFDSIESLLKGTTALTAINVTGNITVGGTVDGRDVATDGTKLDGIETGATADQTKADIDALGIDAATLDSLDSTQFLRSDANDSTSGILTSTNSDTVSGGITVDTNSHAYMSADRGGTTVQAGYMWKTAGSADWYNYISTSSAELKWYTTSNVMTLTTSGSLSTTPQGTLWGSSNDGSGSGLDADTVDGIQASSFLRSDADDSTSGKITSTTSSSDFLEYNGSSTSPYFRFKTSGVNNGYIQFASNGTSYFWNDRQGEGFRIDGSGPMYYNGTAWQTMWHAGNDGSGSGLDADLLDSYNSSQGESTNTVAVRNGYGHLFANYFNGSGTFSTSGATSGMALFTGTNGGDTYGRSYTPNAARAAMGLATTDSPSFAGLNINGNLNAVDNIYVADVISHEGDTDTYIHFQDNTISVVTAGQGEITVNSTGVRLGDTGNGYFQPVTGGYGSIQIDGGAHGGYEGYSIGGRAVFMHDNGNYSGLYNDVNNQWQVLSYNNAWTALYYAGTSKLQTTSTGVNIDGDLNAVDSIYVANAIYHEGDTNTYVSFGTDIVYVVSAGSTNHEFRNTYTQTFKPFYQHSVFYEDYDALSGTSVTVNCDTAQAFSLTMTGNTTFTFNSVSNAWSTGFVLELTGNGSTVTWPTSVDWAGGTAPDAPASGETDIYVFWSRDGGTTWYGVLSVDAAA